MPVLSKLDYEIYFAHKCRYGRSGDNWPQETLLVYRCEWDIECEGHFNKGQIPWSVIRNEEKCHVEEYLLNSLRGKLKTYHSFRYENFQNDLDQFKKNLHMKTHYVQDELKPKGYFSLHIYLSHSPVGDCADRLITFKEEFHPELDVDINISFSNFYKHTEPLNWVGLLKLTRNFDVDEGEAQTFSILNGEERWENFFQEMEVKGTKTLSKWREISTSSRRRERETDDDLMMLHEAIKERVPKKRCLSFFCDFNIHEPCVCGWSHQCVWCETIHEIPHLCNNFGKILALKQEGGDGPVALT